MERTFKLAACAVTLLTLLSQGNPWY